MEFKKVLVFIVLSLVLIGSGFAVAPIDTKEIDGDGHPENYKESSLVFYVDRNLNAIDVDCTIIKEGDRLVLYADNDVSWTNTKLDKYTFEPGTTVDEIISFAAKEYDGTIESTVTAYSKDGYEYFKNGNRYVQRSEAIVYEYEDGILKPKAGTDYVTLTNQFKTTKIIGIDELINNKDKNALLEKKVELEKQKLEACGGNSNSADCEYIQNQLKRINNALNPTSAPPTDRQTEVVVENPQKEVDEPELASEDQPTTSEDLIGTEGKKNEDGFIEYKGNFYKKVNGNYQLYNYDPKSKSYTATTTLVDGNTGTEMLSVTKESLSTLIDFYKKNPDGVLSKSATDFHKAAHNLANGKQLSDEQQVNAIKSGGTSTLEYCVLNDYGGDEIFNAYLTTSSSEDKVEIYSKMTNADQRAALVKSIWMVENKPDQYLSKICEQDMSKCYQDIHKINGGKYFFEKLISDEQKAELFKNADATLAKEIWKNQMKSDFEKYCAGDKAKCENIIVEEALKGSGDSKDFAREKFLEKLRNEDFVMSAKELKAVAADFILTSQTTQEAKTTQEALNGVDCDGFLGSMWCSLTGMENTEQLRQQAVTSAVNNANSQFSILSIPKDAKSYCNDGETASVCQSRYNTECKSDEDKKSDSCKKFDSKDLQKYARLDLYAEDFPKTFKDKNGNEIEIPSDIKDAASALNYQINYLTLDKLNLDGEYLNPEQVYDTEINLLYEEIKLKNELGTLKYTLDGSVDYEAMKADFTVSDKCKIDETECDGDEKVKRDRFNAIIDFEKKKAELNTKLDISTSPYGIKLTKEELKNENDKLAKKCKEMNDDCDAAIKAHPACLADTAVCNSIKKALASADREKTVRTNTAYSIIDAIKNPDQSGLKAAKVFGFEANYENVPEMLRESLPSQMCLDKIDGYLDKEVENNGGVTKYGCDSYNVSVNPSDRCLEVMGDLRAQRSSITPDNKTLVTYSYYVKNPSNPFELTVKYVQNGNWKVFTIENSTSSKNMDSVQIPLNTTEGIEPNSFTINLNTGDLSLTYPIILISSGALQDTIENNGNSQGNYGAIVNGNVNGD